MEQHRYVVFIAVEHSLENKNFAGVRLDLEDEVRKGTPDVRGIYEDAPILVEFDTRRLIPTREELFQDQRRHPFRRPAAFRYRAYMGLSGPGAEDRAT